MSGVIDVRGVEFSYPDGRKVLQGVDLSLQPGEILVCRVPPHRNDPPTPTF